MIRFSILTLLIQLLSFSSFSQCGATSVVPTPQAIGVCEGDSAIIDFAGYGTCTGSYEFQVTLGATVIQPWSTTAQYFSYPTGTNTYTVSVRCSACPTIVASDTFLIEVINQPTVTGVMSICYGDSTQLTASGNPPGSMSWWDAPTGGTQVSNNEILNTGAMTATDTFYVQTTGTVTSGGAVGSILITECGLEGFPGSSSADYIEVSNLYSTPVNTAGWVVAISNSYSNINTVNSVYWQLPNSFAPCSILSKTDVSSQPNYWGNNMFWNATSKSWAIIIDDQGNVKDFIAWGWTAAEIAGFNPTINGFSITLGPEWTGNGCALPCQTVAGTPYSFSRNGSNDNNVAADFVCQATSLNQLNPGLVCGWTAANMTCPYPAEVIVDMPPTASDATPTFVECSADIPAVDPLVITDEADDNGTPTVTFLSEVSDGLSCPETITRTYRVEDSCSNYTDVVHIITVHDTTAPILDPAPQDITVSCSFNIPSLINLNWTDNCDGSGSVTGVDVSDGNTCPETITRTWTYTDNCGNTATETQTIIVNDTIAPVLAAAPPSLNVECYADVPAIMPLNWTDNCDGNGSVNGVEVSDGGFCPETLTRTWTYTDACGNVATETQTIIIHDITAPTASPLPTIQVTTLPAPDPNVITDAADNCSVPLVVFVSDSSDGGFCPETVVRTYSLTDDCGNETLITQNFIVGDPFPEVFFTADPTLLTNLMDNEVVFTNMSTDAVSYHWDFGDGTTDTSTVNPIHYFDNDETAGYVVELIGYSAFGCPDTFKVIIQVREELLYFVPNTFSPDGDEYNQTFKPVFESGFDVHDYNLTVFDRWGEIIFESNDSEVGWDGTYHGSIVPEGTYIWKIEFGLEYTDARKIISGHLNLIR